MDRARLPVLAPAPAEPRDDCSGSDETPRRPRVRGDCEPGGPLYIRPCPFAACRHNLGIDVVHRGSSAELVVRENHRDLSNMPDTCALDVASRGPSEHHEIAALLGITRQMTDIIEWKAKAKLRRKAVRLRHLVSK